MKNSFFTAICLLFCTGCLGSLSNPDRGYRGSGFSRETLDSMGVNTEHVFVFDEQQMRYNDKSIRLFEPIDSLELVFGTYDRVERDESSEKIRLYYWDDIGLQAISYDSTSIETIKIFWAVCLPYFYNKEEDDEQCRERIAEAPRKFFEGKILLNGLPVGLNTDFREFCNNQSVKSEIKRLSGGKYERYEALYYSLPMGNWSHHGLHFFDYSTLKTRPEWEPYNVFYEYTLSLEPADRTAGSSECYLLKEFEFSRGIYKNPDYAGIGNYLH